MTIKKVQAQMEGAYECRASNGEGTDSVAANLKVVRETTIIEGKYIFLSAMSLPCTSKDLNHFIGQ